MLVIGFQSFAVSNQSLVYQGRVVRPDGSLPNAGTITFSLSVYSPAPSQCLLYSESHSVNMTGSHGMFSLALGAGTRSDGLAHPFNNVFINGGTLSGLTCADGSTSYTAGATDDRSLKVSFDDASTVVNLSAMSIKSVPFALQAHQIDGWGLDNLVKVSSIGSPTTFTTTEMVQAKTITGLTCASGEIIKWNGTAWACGATPTTGTVTDVTASAPLASSGGATPNITITQSSATVDGYLSSADWSTFNSKLGTSSTFAGDVSGTSGTTSVDKIKGTGVTITTLTAGNFLKFDGTSWINTLLAAADIPALDAAKITTGTVPVARGGTGAASFAANRLLASDGTGSTVQIVTPCALNQVLSFDATGLYGCYNVGSIFPAAFVDGGNSFGAAATLGTNDNFALNFETNGTTKMTLDSAGRVGVGTTTPGTALDVVGSVRAYSTTADTNLDIGRQGDAIYYNSLRIYSGYNTTGPTWRMSQQSGLNNLEAAQDISIKVGGAEKMRVGVNGNVGIGIANPSYPLHVLTTNPGAQIGSTVAFDPNFTADHTSGNLHGSWFQLGLNNNFNVAPALYGSVNRVHTTVGTTGNISDAFGSTHDVENFGDKNITRATGANGAVSNTGSGIVSQAMGLSSSINNSGTGSVTTGYGLYIGNIAATNRYSVYASDSTAANYFAGNMGVGTSTPAYKLDISGSVRAESFFAKTFNLPADGNWYKVAEMNGQFCSFDFVYENDTGFNPAMQTGTITAINDKFQLFFEQMSGAYGSSNNAQFARSGNAGESAVVWAKGSGSIGSFTVTRYKDCLIHLDGTNVATLPAGAGLVVYDQASGGSHLFSGNLGIGNVAPSKLLHVGSNLVGSGVAVADFQNVDGTCTITPAASGSGIACSSDERLKENFQDVSGEFALDKILQLQSVTYNFKTSNKLNRRTGYKAQQVQKIAPEFVRENQDGFLQVYYDAFIPWITEAMKTFHKRMMQIESDNLAQDRQISLKAAQKDLVLAHEKIHKLEFQIAQLRAKDAENNSEIEKIKANLEMLGTSLQTKPAQ